MPQSTVTIATHNGSQIARQHNLRNRKVVDKETHIDPSGTHETWVDVAPRTAYKDIFGDAVKRYNARQTRSDRKIYDYYKSIQENPKKHTAYQMRERVNEIEAAEKDAAQIREAADQYADDIRRGADFDMQRQFAQRKAEYDKLMQQCQQIQLKCNDLQKIIDACPDAQEMQLKQLRERERIDPWQPNRRRRFTRDIEIER